MTLLHTAIRVSDVESNVAFYDELVGFEVVRSFETDDGTRNVFLGHPDPSAADDAALQLVESDEPVETGDFEHVALAVADVDSTVDDLDDRRIIDGPMTLDEVGVRVAFIEGPDGWEIELIENLE
ncbi:VOC family protein [Halosolutus gelatinilyticus]|uniref:VOC family protein n=1 Tax=Halosolutus gelatinilyticus TaxID=2931975 RepID=UPI001FF3CE37|nr:VOC family protein [Halosolutus gelatinilyticus]